MSVSRVITIPSPVLPASPAGTFSYVIKNSAGATVASGTCTNAPFTVTGFTTDSYQLFATYNDNTSVWCFDVVDCECPDLVSAEITRTVVDGAYLNYITFTFDMTDGFPNCPFTIRLNPGMPDAIAYGITSLSDLNTTGTPGIYQISFLIGSLAHIVYQIFKADGVSCYGPTTVNFECEDPGIPQFWGYTSDNPTPRWITPTPGFFTTPPDGFIHGCIYSSGGSLYIKMRFPDCGGTCHAISVNFDEGCIGCGGQHIHADYALDCGDTYPLENDVLITPLRAPGSMLPPAGYGYTYTVQFTSSCCGAGAPVIYVTM